MSSSDIAISVRGISKEYTIIHEDKPRTLAEKLSNRLRNPLHRPRQERFWALNDVSFDVKKGEVIGIIGRNGAGKSTLLKVLSRITEPTAGEIQLFGRVGSLLEVGTGFHPELTGRENIFLNGAILGMTRPDIRRHFDEIVAFAEVDKFLDTPVKRYSSGMYVRLAFAVAAHLNPEILIVDEVLSVGDADFQNKCLGKMREVSQGDGRTVLFVSHNMRAISHLCSRGVVLSGGRVLLLGSAEACVQAYGRGARPGPTAKGEDEPHILFRKNPDGKEFAITRLEVVDSEGRPKPDICTWDSFSLRFTIHALRPLSKASVVLEILTGEGLQLVLLSTRPDGTLPLSFRAGEQQIECRIQKLPLSAGEYVLGAGLAIPGSEWLWREREIARLDVLARDVFGSGLAPHAGRALMAPEHSWKVVSLPN